MAHIVKKCNCRSESGKKLGSECPALAQRNHGAWWFRYEAPRAADGKRRRPWAGPYATKTAAQTDATQIEAAIDAGTPDADRSIKAGTYFDSWLEGKRGLKKSTRAMYREAIELYAKPGIGHLKMISVREHHLEELYAAMARINNLPPGQEPTELLRRLLAVRAKATWTRSDESEPGLWQRRKVSPSRIRGVHAVIRSAMSTAVKRKILTHNPATHVELPKVPRRRPLVWTPTRVETWRRTGRRPAPVMVWTPQLAGQFLDRSEDDGERLFPLYHLVTTRGLRRGEAWGAEWVNVELDPAAGTGTLSVREDESDDDGQELDRASVKSASGWRTITLDAENVKLLARWRRRQAAERLAAGDAWVDSGRVFTGEDGAPVRIDFIGDHFDVLVRRYGLPPIRFHDLRHCAASLMLSAGVDMKVVSATLGHRQYAFTADVYASVLPQLEQAAAEATVAIIPRRRRPTGT